MTRAPVTTIAGLCEQSHNETAHTDHVAALALWLFDELREPLKLAEADRPILETAARLHDVGYATHPIRHAEVGAEIARAHRLTELHPTQRPYAAAAILFHAGNWKPLMQHPFVTGLANPDRATRLGAILRVADGLDWGHLQDATLTGLDISKRGITVKVHAPHFPFNIRRANEKADLWRAVMPVAIRFVRANAGRYPTPSLLVTDTHLMEAARRLFALQYKTVLAHVDEAVRGVDAEALHTIRVAIRRLRLLLRHFKPVLRSPLTGPILETLGELGRTLGPARDADVWIEFLQQHDAARHRIRPNRSWRMFFDAQIERRRFEYAVVRRYLRGSRFMSLRRRMAQLLRVELPGLVRQPPPASLPVFAEKRFRKIVKAALKKRKLRKRDDPSALHDLRIALRKARYTGEFFEPVLDEPLIRLRRRIRKTEQTLARIHDLDMALDHLRAQGITPRALIRSLQQQRRQRMRDIEPAWKKLESTWHSLA